MQLSTPTLILIAIVLLGSLLITAGVVTGAFVLVVVGGAILLGILAGRMLAPSVVSDDLQDEE